ncbi:MAG: hypothetical protein ABEK50_01155 [bacterium]
MNNENSDESGSGLSNLTLGLLFFLFVVLWFLTSIVWGYFWNFN